MKRIFNPTPYDPLYREVMRRSLDIQHSINKYDHHDHDIPFNEWKELKRRFWNEYIYPKFEKAYYEIFPDEKGIKNDPNRFKGDFNVLDYNQKMVIALCALLKRDGFFHFFEGKLFFINLDPTDVTFVLTDGVPFLRYPIEHIGTLLEGVTLENAKIHRKIDKLTTWIFGISIIATILICTLILMIIQID